MNLVGPRSDELLAFICIHRWLAPLNNPAFATYRPETAHYSQLSQHPLKEGALPITRETFRLNSSGLP